MPLRGPLLSTMAALLTAVAGPAAAQAPVIDWSDRTEVVYRSESVGAYRVVTVVDELQDPWSIAWLPNGDMLVTEKPGRLRLVRDGELRDEPIAGVPEVHYVGQGGLFEVALHPDFDSNRLLYLSYSRPNDDGTESTTAVVRGRLEDRGLVDVDDVFEAEAWGEGGGHYGGRLVFDEDGYLFITVGDRTPSSMTVNIPVEEHPAQDRTNHKGTTIRLHDDGRVPADNPFVDDPDALPEIWSYGHRNAQGMTIHPETGDLWQTEHGPQGGDELNLILPGRNYGWPVVGYGVHYGGAPIHEGTHREGMEPPVWYWTPSIATSGLLAYAGDRFPEWRGSLLAGGLAGQRIERLPVVEEEDGYLAGRLERPALLLGFGRVRDVREGPDGYVYVAIDDRTHGEPTPIVRLEPVR